MILINGNISNHSKQVDEIFTELKTLINVSTQLKLDQCHCRAEELDECVYRVEDLNVSTELTTFLKVFLELKALDQCAYRVEDLDQCVNRVEELDSFDATNQTLHIKSTSKKSFVAIITFVFQY